MVYRDQIVKVHPHRSKIMSGKRECISVSPLTGSGVEYFGTVSLYDVRFVIHNSGVSRAVQEQRRNVHAWAVGTLVDFYPTQHNVPDGLFRRGVVEVTYHYNVGRFLTVNDDPNEVIDVTDGHFKVAWFFERHLFVSTF